MTTMHSLSRLLVAALVCGAAFFLAGTAQAQPDIRMSGSVSYTHTDTTAVLGIDRIQNNSVANGISGGVRLQLWALRAPFSGLGEVGYEQGGHLMAQYDLGPLMPNRYFASVNTGPIPFTPPPPGSWYVTMLVTDYRGGSFNASGFLATDYRNFPVESFSQSSIAAKAAPALMPKVGLWWNPAESGSGYGIDYTGGTLVVTVYSYKPNGDPQWYLAVGPLDGGTMSATLDKYRNGQCIGCAYAGSPADAGNDGAIGITFHSSTSATVTLPGGRVASIQPMF